MIFDFIIPAYPILSKHFKICGLFYLNEYTDCMPELYSKLKILKKDSYAPSERFIFVLDDVDFHLDENSPGFTLYNLQVILADLDIPNYFCLILSNRPDYDEYTKIVQKQLTTDPCHIRSITNLLDLNWVVPVIQEGFNFNELNYPTWVVPIVRKKFNLAEITRPFCVLSRKSRSHRSYFMSQLFKHNLQQVGIVGYNNITEPTTNNESSTNNTNHLSFLSRRTSEPILIYREENRNTFNQFLNQYPSYKNFKESLDLMDPIKPAEFLSDSPILQSLIYVGLETIVNPSKLFITRISLRGIIEQRPFILLAQPGMLKFLKSLGFKTFSDFWDESYDDIQNLEDRVDALINILTEWSTLTIEELHSQAARMQSIIEYNYNYYVNDFEKILSDELDKNCQLNLSQIVC